jgi:hypothetical protein
LQVFEDKMAEREGFEPSKLRQTKKLLKGQRSVAPRSFFNVCNNPHHSPREASGVNGLPLGAEIGGSISRLNCDSAGVRTAAAVEHKQEAPRRFQLRFSEATGFENVLHFDGQSFHGVVGRKRSPGFRSAVSERGLLERGDLRRLGLKPGFQLLRGHSSSVA